MRNEQSTAGPVHDVLSAYRAELARRTAGGSLSTHDGEWLAVGVLLGHAAAATGEHHAELLSSLRIELRALLGETRWERGLPSDASPPDDALSLSPRVRLLCEWIEDEGAVVLADTVARTYVISGDRLTALERGRFDALRARLAWKRGDHAAAEDLYAAVERGVIACRAVALERAELEVRALTGHAVLARLRGNSPDSGALAERAVHVAEAHGLSRLGAVAHHVLMVVAATAGKHDVALHHAWRAFDGVRGDETAEGVQLADVAQLFYLSGQLDVAAAGFDVSLRRPLPARSRLPALGGAALTAARRGERVRVALFAERVRREGEATVLPYATAASWLDVAEACLLVGEEAAGHALLESALEITHAHGYHELAFRAQQLTAPVQRIATASAAPARMTRESEEIGRAIRELAGAVG
jgi:hypothetical protein